MCGQAGRLAHGTWLHRERAAVAADRREARVQAHLEAQQHRPAAEDVARERDEDEREADPDDRVDQDEHRGEDDSPVFSSQNVVWVP